jgi:hypothetical protein
LIWTLLCVLLSRYLHVLTWTCYLHVLTWTCYLQSKHANNMFMSKHVNIYLTAHIITFISKHVNNMFMSKHVIDMSMLLCVLLRRYLYVLTWTCYLHVLTWTCYYVYWAHIITFMSKHVNNMVMSKHVHIYLTVPTLPPTWSKVTFSSGSPLTDFCLN